MSDKWVLLNDSLNLEAGKSIKYLLLTVSEYYEGVLLLVFIWNF